MDPSAFCSFGTLVVVSRGATREEPPAATVHFPPVLLVPFKYCQIARHIDCVYVYMYHPGGTGGVGRTEEAGEGADEGNEDGEGCTGQQHRIHCPSIARLFRFVFARLHTNRMRARRMSVYIPMLRQVVGNSAEERGADVSPHHHQSVVIPLVHVLAADNLYARCTNGRGAPQLFSDDGTELPRLRLMSSSGY